MRLTAKSTQFGKKTFTSWLIESAGTVPLQRRKDFENGQVDNAAVMEKLMEVCQTLRSYMNLHDDATRHTCPSFDWTRSTSPFTGTGIRRCRMFVPRRNESIPPYDGTSENGRCVPMMPKPLFETVNSLPPFVFSGPYRV